MDPCTPDLLNLTPLVGLSAQPDARAESGKSRQGPPDGPRDASAGQRLIISAEHALGCSCGDRQVRSAKAARFGGKAWPVCLESRLGSGRARAYRALAGRIEPLSSRRLWAPQARARCRACARLTRAGQQDSSCRCSPDPVLQLHDKMVDAPQPPRETQLLYRDLNGREPELAVSAQGAYITLDDGRV